MTYNCQAANISFDTALREICGPYPQGGIRPDVICLQEIKSIIMDRIHNSRETVVSETTIWGETFWVAKRLDGPTLGDAVLLRLGWLRGIGASGVPARVTLDSALQGVNLWRPGVALTINTKSRGALLLGSLHSPWGGANEQRRAELLTSILTPLSRFNYAIGADTNLRNALAGTIIAGPTSRGGYPYDRAVVSSRIRCRDYGVRTAEGGSDHRPAFFELDLE